MTHLPPTAAEFLGALRSERGLATNTVAAYRRDLTEYFAYLEDAGVDHDVAGYVRELAERGRAASTRGRKLAAVRGYYRFLIVEGLSEIDPTVLVETPRRGRPLPKALPFETVERLLEVPDLASPIGIRDTAILEFLYGTGARVSEAITVEITDLDLEAGTVILTGKGDKQRLVPLGRHARDAIHGYLPIRHDMRDARQRSDALFLNARGRSLTRQGMWEIVKRNGRDAGIAADDLSPHVLRHSAATHMIEGGADLRTVQELLGHASISTTQVYTLVSPEHLREVFV
ncbi:MAG: site-specific tyrosine recombinase XerD, partial [Actinomycetota bacterium]